MSAPYGVNQGGYGYPGQQPAYPPQTGGYPGQQPAYPPQTGGYPGQQPAYPHQTGGYPGQQPAYPPQTGGYPGQQPAYLPQTGGYPGQQPAYPPQNTGFAENDPRAQRLNQVTQRYEVSPQFGQRLHALLNCEIVLLCDDSGSMNAPLQGSNQTRWDELKHLVSIVTDICTVLDSNGVDVYFLNRAPMLNVTNAQNVQYAFSTPPQGLTPLVPKLREILAAKRDQSYEKNLIILIATDGAPTGPTGEPDIATLEGVLRNERTPLTYVTFLACTDDLQAVNYLSYWDKAIPKLDVLDDYRSERTEIQRVRGVNFPFSFGDYIVKALLGAIDPWFDSLDASA